MAYGTFWEMVSHLSPSCRYSPTISKAYRWLALGTWALATTMALDERLSRPHTESISLVRLTQMTRARPTVTQETQASISWTLL